MKNHRLVLPYVACLVPFALYAFARRWQTLLPSPLSLLTEGALLAYLLALLVFPLREGRFRWFAATLPLAYLYSIHDEFLVRWGDVPNLGDFALLADLFVVLSPLEKLGAIVALALPCVCWVVAFDITRMNRRGAWLCAPALLVAVAIVVLPVPTYAALRSFSHETEWSNKRGAGEYGRLVAALMREARKRAFKAQLSEFTPLSRSALTLSPALLRELDGRNVHVIVLESFVDLTRMSEVQFTPSPMHASLTDRYGAAFGSSISPVFGGETARAEFEVLCGVPSLGLHGIEFLAFTGHETYCLPTILRGAGYRSVLSFPHGPVFFNTRRAYPALGFDQLIFGAPYSQPGQEAIDTHDQDYLFDAQLFEQNLAKVRQLVAANTPFLNYVMTIYGHWPFDLDPALVQEPVKPSVNDEDLMRIASQMRARSEALATYVRGLTAIDPSALIVMVGDHLPPLPTGHADYARYGYEGHPELGKLPPESLAYDDFLLVVDAGTPVKLPRMRHFDLSRWLLDRLSHGAYCREKRCDFGSLPMDPARYLDAYRTVLGLASLEK